MNKKFSIGMFKRNLYIFVKTIIMWICPKCERSFKSDNQSHICNTNTIDDIFEGKSDNMIMAFDKVLIGVIDWDPCTVGTSSKSIVFTKSTAWLIVRPMAKVLDIKFYFPTLIQHRLIKKTNKYPKKVAHHIRISDESEVTTELLNLLRRGYDGK